MKVDRALKWGCASTALAARLVESARNISIDRYRSSPQSTPYFCAIPGKIWYLPLGIDLTVYFDEGVAKEARFFRRTNGAGPGWQSSHLVVKDYLHFCMDVPRFAVSVPD